MEMVRGDLIPGHAEGFKVEPYGEFPRDGGEFNHTMGAWQRPLHGYEGMPVRGFTASDPASGLTAVGDDADDAVRNLRRVLRMRGQADLASHPRAPWGPCKPDCRCGVLELIKERLA